jgi:hypothetical protein
MIKTDPLCFDNTRDIVVLRLVQAGLVFVPFVAEISVLQNFRKYALLQFRAGATIY